MQMRFTYPKMKSPSMHISHVDPHGVVLVYRSSRQGFTDYLKGNSFNLKKKSLSIHEKKIFAFLRFAFSNSKNNL